MLRSLTLCLVLAPAVAFASPCYQLSDDAARLACYDRIADCFRVKSDHARLACLDAGLKNDAMPAEAQQSAPESESQPVVEESQVIPETPAKPEAPADASNFGKAQKQADHMTSTIVKVEHRFDGVDFITLANKQVWRETMDQTNRFKVGQVVTITPAIFGSYSLRSDDLGRLVKVRRVD